MLPPLQVLGFSQVTQFEQCAGIGELRRLRQVEDENRKLKHLVADLTLHKPMPREALPTNG